MPFPATAMGATPTHGHGRLYRLAHVVAIAADVLEDKERASRWLRKPNRALGGEVPLRLLDTEVGAR